ncbi:MAG TPA: hypothetical protein PLR26_00205 [Bacilli bacterium]|nr:hypothetical protein [Bacilli bacterium]
MFLSLLNKEEKHYFVDFIVKIVSFDGEMSELETQIVNRMKGEMGPELDSYKVSTLSLEELTSYFSTKPKVTRNIVFMNILAASLVDEWYSAEEHFLIESIQLKLNISDKKRLDFFKVVYAERDLRERAKRIITE